MTNCFAAKSDAQIFTDLSSEIQLLRRLGPDDQQRIISMARGLAEREMAMPFIMAGVRSSAEVLVDLKDSRPDPVMTRPEVQRFLAENSVPPGRSGVIHDNDVKRMERERLQQKTAAAIRNARCSRGRHEIKKTRSILMKIDQRALRHRLGREGDDLCREINTILRSMAAQF